MAKKNPLSVSFNDFEISACFKGTKRAPWDTNSYNRHYVVTVRGGNTHSNKIQFDYWTSQISPEMKEPKEVIDAFAEFLIDVMAGYGSAYQEFCREFGYNPFDDAPKSERDAARRAFEGCCRNFVKWQKLTDMDARDVYSMLT